MTPTEAAWVRENVWHSRVRITGHIGDGTNCVCQYPRPCTACSNGKHDQCGPYATDTPFETQLSEYGQWWPIRARVWLADRTCRRPCNCAVCAAQPEPEPEPVGAPVRGGTQLALI